MTKLSVNVNKFATIRNARGGNNPNLSQVVKDCERFGAQGITIHPRPDERHITTKDVYDIKPLVTTEYNIEGYPDKRYLQLVRETKPDQATLVPDGPDVLTSNKGWDTINNKEMLKDIISELKSYGVRTSIFVDPDPKMAEAAAETGADRVELYTEDFAINFLKDKSAAVLPYIEAANAAKNAGLGINAGHDLDLTNLKYLVQQIPYIDEVSIGHALVCDALYYGLENTIQLYLKQLS
ncbi:pyridoxine 5'-phosphate synthase [Marinigracilibium pacificum]|uniref:Pyridoxine 5'-phosphate synthase n=1 Tax=Marinigracilibium pacificum TaxID=2729599 RepID=A0A848J255_9BACT|nr:pyridoxine 5'-phosphate synthase [Marinigracilibium pacificum]NMM49801.1 pyridoxine 5'-phosphate synthase [Marinigracilibium pacificum]